MLPEFCAEAHKKIAVSTPSRATAAKDSIANPNAPLVIRAPSTCVLKLFANPLDAVRIQKIIPVTKPTAIFLWASAQNSGSMPTLVGGFTGIAISIFLGYLIYLGAVKLNLSVFFRITGLLLIVVAAGVLTYGIHEYQELGWLPGINSIAYDISGSIDPTGFVATMFKGLLSLRTSMSWLEVFAYLSYIVIVTVIFLRPSRVAKTVKEEIKIS